MTNDMVVSFPRMGNEYTEIFKELLEDLGFKVVIPPLKHDGLKFGIKNTPSMVCFPMKTSLADMKVALDLGANTIIMYDTKGLCRFRHYWKIQKQILNENGYNPEFIILTKKFFFQLKKASKLSYFRTWKIIKKYWKIIKEIDKENKKFSNDKINIAIIGEIYCCLEPSVNYDVINKLKKYNVNPVFTITLTDFITEVFEDTLKLNLTGKKEYLKKAKTYLNGPIGGHGERNIANTLWLCDKKIDGIIHLLPLVCMPDTMIEPIINKICKENNVPLLRIPIDETSSEANLSTRIETFVELIRRKKE